MHNLGGPEWEEWNRQIRDTLVRAQRKDGPFAGSWDPRTQWGGYGGRVYSTAIATLTLEVYYRFLPFYNLRLKPQDAAAKKTPDEKNAPDNGNAGREKGIRKARSKSR
jgi:hypothetical protein